MSNIVHFCEGDFGRLQLLEFETPLVEHSHLECQMVFALTRHTHDIVTVNGDSAPLNYFTGAAMNSLESHAHPGVTPGSRYLVIYLDPEWVQRNFTVGKGALRFAKNHFSLSFELREAIDQLVALPIAAEAPGKVEILVSNIVELTQKCSAAAANINLQSASGNLQKIDFRLHRSMAFMRKNMDQRTSIDHVASAAGISRPRLFELFRKQIRTTPNIFWNALRIERAKRELLTSDTSLTELSTHLGFSEPGNFSRFFRNHTGVCPTEFRSKPSSD